MDNTDNIQNWITNGASTMAKFIWLCPNCGVKANVGEHERLEGQVPLGFTGKGAGVRQVAHPVLIKCLDRDCDGEELTVHSYIANKKESSNAFASKERYEYVDDRPISSWRLIPRSNARHLPDYIPRSIREDYEEACLICDLSPKASATLARRSLQGMIRDFHGIKKKNLYEEIKALQGEVSTEAWSAIDSLRRVGNVGAHMEKDISVIVDVEPNEANMLIKLIEMLIDDWYVARHERSEKFQAITELADDKEQQRKQNTQN
jgi:hypothetical protein